MEFIYVTFLKHEDYFNFARIYWMYPFNKHLQNLDFQYLHLLLPPHKRIIELHLVGYRPLDNSETQIMIILM